MGVEGGTTDTYTTCLPFSPVIPVMYHLTEVISYGDLCRDLADSSATVCWCQALMLLSSNRTTCLCRRGMSSAVFQTYLPAFR